MKLAVLVSGGLGYDTLKKVHQNYTISCVFTDGKSEIIIKYCEENNLPYFKGNPRGGLGYAFIKPMTVDVLVSINYLFLIEDDIINHPKKIAFNLHGSLLPKYRGRTPHVWAIINNEEKTGITAHQINIGCDTGAIISQVEIPIGKQDTGAVILEKYKDCYYPLVKKVLGQIELNELRLKKQEESEATYFGKRSPKDGGINWNWSKERIYNWVRAQASPYPGAFSYYKEDKVIIDKVSFSSHGYHFEDCNGEIIAISPKVLIKTPNGIIALESIRTEKKLNFEIGKKLEQC